VRVVSGASQQQAATEHEPACGRGGCGRGRGVSASETAQSVGACVVSGRARAPAHSTAGEGSWCWLEAGVVCGMRVRGGRPVTDGGLRVLGGGLLGFYVAGSGQI
jgi:hypothetical protein